MELHASLVAQRVLDFRERCREAGMNLTPQRLAIYRALLEAQDHPSPEVLFRRVHPTMPSLSLATIYKTLDTLAKLGLVREVAVVGESKRYDANLDRHHHLVCTQCKKVTDLYDAAFDALRPPHDLRGFRAQAVSVQVTGLCAECARNKRR